MSTLVGNDPTNSTDNSTISVSYTEVTVSSKDGSTQTVTTYSGIGVNQSNFMDQTQTYTNSSNNSTTETDYDQNGNVLTTNSIIVSTFTDANNNTVTRTQYLSDGYLFEQWDNVTTATGSSTVVTYPDLSDYMNFINITNTQDANGNPITITREDSWTFI